MRRSTPVRLPPWVSTIAVLSLMGMASCGRAGTYTGECCAAGLIDPGKLLQPNLPGSPAGAMTYLLEYRSGQTFDLAALLLKPAGEPLVWMVNGLKLADSRLELKKVPGEDRVVIYRVSANRPGENRRDEFRLISLPAGTRERFAAWLERERNDTAWLAALPPVYSTLGPQYSDPEPRGCKVRYWEGVHKLDSHFHPGGAWEMRSKPVAGGHGHQAVYDSAGRLIRQGAGAGSADKGAPTFFGLIHHRDRDVRPYVWAAQLDGNPVNATRFFLNLDAPLLREGKHIAEYQSVRPALWGSPAEVAAGTCIATR